MKLTSVQAIIRALDEAKVRFLVVGGLAVNAYGHHRFTRDVDVVLDLARDNLERAFAALADLGYRPSVPVTPAHLASDATREVLIQEKGMRVLQFWSDRHRETPIDAFVDLPFPFDEEYARATTLPLSGAGPVPFVARPMLIRMKEAAGRPQDLLDIHHLKELDG